jgi:anti-anti-sigma factor
MAKPQSQQKARIEYNEVAPGVIEIRISGAIGLSSMPSFTGLMARLAEKGHSRIVFNLTDLAYIASSGIGCLISSAEKAREMNGDVIVAAAPAKVKHVFDAMGLGRVIKFTESVGEAVAQLKAL